MGNDSEREITEKIKGQRYRRESKMLKGERDIYIESIVGQVGQLLLPSSRNFSWKELFVLLRKDKRAQEMILRLSENFTTKKIPFRSRIFFSSLFFYSWHISTHVRKSSRSVFWRQTCDCGEWFCWRFWTRALLLLLDKHVTGDGQKTLNMASAFVVGQTRDWGRKRRL